MLPDGWLLSTRNNLKLCKRVRVHLLFVDEYRAGLFRLSHEVPFIVLVGRRRVVRETITPSVAWCG